MQPAHPHLLINHFPIVGLSIALLTLGITLILKHKPTLLVALALVFLTGFSALPANLSGEAAEEAIENSPGMSRDLIHAHEEAAEASLIGSLITAALAAIAFFLVYKDHRLGKIAAMTTLVIAAGTLSMNFNTGYLGGKIKHDEIRNGPAPASGGGVEQDND